MSASTSTKPTGGTNTTTESTISSLASDQSSVRPGIIRSPRHKKKNRFRSTNTALVTVEKSLFKGETEGINVVLSLSTEDARVGYDGFRNFKRS